MHFISLFIYLLFNLLSLPIEILAEELSLSIGGLLVAYRLYNFNKHRRVLSELIDELNLLNWTHRTEREEFSRLNYVIHYWQLVIGTLMTTMGGGIGIPQAAFAMYQGILYYNHIFPVDTSGYTTAYYVLWAFQSFAVTSCTITSTLQECMLIDCYVQLSFNYYMLNRKAEALRWNANGSIIIDEELEYDKLIQIIKGSQQLER